MAVNKRMNKAKTSKNDEFYTRLEDIESELRHYKEHFKDKVVLCNCDDPRVSNFTRYFVLNFEFLGLKKLICTCYKNAEPELFSRNESESAIYMVYEGDKDGNRKADDNEYQINHLKGDGDFRSVECIELLKEADIVVTNPPFSLMKEYMLQLLQYNKKFLILGSMNTIHYTEIFPYIQRGELWLGYGANKTMTFALPDHYEKWNEIIDGVKYGKVPSICWFTNLDTKKRHEDLILYKHYSPEEYTKYDNFDAIEVKKVNDIPCDWDGMMGVPDSFLGVYNPEQFEILGADCIPEYAERLGIRRIGEEWMARYRAAGGTGHYTANMKSLVITEKGKPKKVFSRIIIRRR